MTTNQNNILQQISNGKISQVVNNNGIDLVASNALIDPEKDERFIFNSPKMRNKYLRALVNEYRENNKLSEEEIVDGLLLLDERIESKQILPKDVTNFKI